jgi:hypothetical protein
MLLVLLALLGGSLAFAQYLVVRTHQPPFMATSLQSFGFTTPQQPIDTEEVQALSGLVAGHPRRVDLFAWEQPALTADEQTDAAAQLFLEIANAAPQETTPSHLAGRAAIQVAGPTPDGQFLLLRLTQVQDHLVAIGYSGPGPYTDTDKAMFNTLCKAGIRFNIAGH